MFLTAGFSCWGINSFLLLIIGFMVENVKISALKMALIYVLIGILTAFFTATCESDLSVGNLGVLSGLTFALLAELIVNFKALEKVGNGSFRLIMIFLPVILFIFVLMSSFVPELSVSFKQ